MWTIQVNTRLIKEYELDLSRKSARDTFTEKWASFTWLSLRLLESYAMHSLHCVRTHSNERVAVIKATFKTQVPRAGPMCAICRFESLCQFKLLGRFCADHLVHLDPRWNFNASNFITTTSSTRFQPSSSNQDMKTNYPVTNYPVCPITQFTQLPN